MRRMAWLAAHKAAGGTTSESAGGAAKVPTMSPRMLAGVAVAAVAYLVLPGHPLGWLSGLPWGPVSLAVGLAIGVAVFGLWPVGPAQPVHPAPPAAGRRVAWAILGTLVVLGGAKAVVGALALPHGLPAWYYANSRFAGEHEGSTDYPNAPWTRQDAVLDFGGDEFPVYFLNDVQRFNFFGPEAERRKNLPFAVRWQGTLYAPEAGTYPMWLTASGPAALAVNGKGIASVDEDRRATAATAAELRQGANEIRVTYARRPPRSGDLKVEWGVDGRRRFLAAPYVFASPVDTSAWQRDRTLLAVSRALDGAFLAVLVGTLGGLVVQRARSVWSGTGRRWALVERPLLALWLAGMVGFALLPDLDRVGKFELLGGGQDWLTHEAFARDVLLNGPLMTLGKPLGEGRTFYAQPFYPYALAAFHWLTGEDQYGAVALQLVGTGVAGVLIYFLAKRLFGVPAALAAFGLFVALRAWHLDWVVRRLLSESVYFVILPAMLLLLVRYLDERRRSDLLLGGLFLGLAIVTRGTTLLYVPLLTILLWRGLRMGGLPPRAALGRTAALLAVAGAIVVLVPIRNYVVAGQPAIVASSGGVNLQKLHRPTPRVRLNEAHGRWFAPYIEDAPTRETVEFILQDPGGYAATYVPLVLYTLGYGAAIEESHVALWPDLVLLNVLYLAAILLLPAARSVRAGLLHAFVAIHFVTMVVFAPYDYDNRLVLPMYLPIAVFAGALLAAAAVGAWRRVADARRGSVLLAERSPVAEQAP